MRKKSVVLIVNPKAGKCKGIKRLGDIIQTIQQNGCLPTVLLTQKSGDARQFAFDYGNEVDIVCCVGGDGTFSEVVAGMVGGKHSTPIGYIPSGSTNDYAASLNLPSDLQDAASVAVNGYPQSFDIGILNDHPFAYVAAFGMLAKVSYNAPQDLKNVLGHFAYILEGICDLHTLRAERMSIDTDTEHFDGEFLLGTISNTTSIGGILQFSASDVQLNDGYLEVLLIAKPITTREFAQIIQALRTRVYTECDCIIYRKCKTVRITSQNSIPWTLDGEEMDGDLNNEIKNVPNAIRVMVQNAKRDV